MQFSETIIPKRNKTEYVEPYIPQSHEHRQQEPPTTPPTKTTIWYMTNGHPDRDWKRDVWFDIFCFVPFRYNRFSTLDNIH
jgi:hypothetical protein